MKKAIFIDKDGTLIKDVPYNVDPGRILLESGATEAIRRWRADGFHVIVVFNQSGIARGYFTVDDLEQAVSALRDLLKQNDADIDDFYYCPHHPEGVVADYAIHCTCRKPNPDLLKKAAQEWNINISESWMIGDILNDVEAGMRAGCKTVLIDNGNETEWNITHLRTPTIVVNDLKQAAEKILEYQRRQYA